MNSGTHIEAARRLRERWPSAKPWLGIVLGSGWKSVAEAFEPIDSVPLDEITPPSGPRVPGHSSQLVWARHAGGEILVFLGRRHWYEGLGWEPVLLPVRLLYAFGASALLLTNSAGGIRSGLEPGSLMLIDDHVNLMGVNPLLGSPDPDVPARFPDMSAVYDPALKSYLLRAADRLRVTLSRGIYLATTGPAYETPAEIAAFRTMGADVVGMSTVPEAVFAYACGLRVAGLSCVTNPAAGTGTSLSHNEVLRAAASAAEPAAALIRAFVENARPQTGRPE